VELSVLSYNIHKGFSRGNRKFVLSQIRDSIRAAGADIVLLQEVIGEHSGHKERHSDWPTVEQFEFLADSVWSHYAYGRNAVYDEGHHGNAVLSKFPILSFDNFDISTGKHEQRGILHTRIELPGLPIKLDCYCTHLGLFHRMRVQQFQSICDWIERTSEPRNPLLLGGDFNDWSQKACSVLEQRLQVTEAYRNANGKLARTFPSFWPILTLDRIYSRSFAVQSAEALHRSPWNRLSDHAPILARFALQNVV